MTVELTTDDAPPFDDVDTIVPVIRVELVVETDPNTQTATEEIADDLAQTRPAAPPKKLPMTWHRRAQP